MKRGVMALLAAAAVAITAAGSVIGADKAKDTAAAAAAAQGAGITCTVTDSAPRGTVKTGKADTTVYEVACQQGLGYLVGSSAGQPAFMQDCVAARDNAAAAKGKGGAAVCTLPGNANPEAGFQPIVDATPFKGCTVSKVQWMGRSETAHIDRYEVACAQGQAFLLDQPVPGGGGKQVTTSCLAAEASGYDCKLMNKAAQTAYLSKLAASTGKACSVKDARYVGTTKSDTDFYEVACSGANGYMFETDASGKLLRSVDCGDPSLPACTLTDASVMQAGLAQATSGRLKAAGMACTPSQQRVVGTETTSKRDLVELQCPEHPYGFVALLPTSASTAKAEGYDCIRASSRRMDCQLTPAAAQKPLLSKAISAGGRTCDVTDWKSLGILQGANADLIEVSCGGGAMGLIIHLAADRAKATEMRTCANSKAAGLEACSIPGNH